MIVGTPESRLLCKRIAAKTDTVVFGFSRGKDSIAAWLWLSEFFPRIIPFHVDGCPGLVFVERSLDEYERQFGVAIERYVSKALMNSLSEMVFQPVEDEPWIDSLALYESMGNDEIAECVRDRHDAGGAWIAWGISCEDSIVRKSQAKYRSGINESKRVFYPCFNWRREHVLQAINARGLRLPADYLMANRSFSSPLNPRHLLRMRAQRPEDFERVKFFYPLIEAALARNEFRKTHSAAGKSTSKSPSLPLTGSGSASNLGEPSTHANSEVGSTSQQAATESAATIG